MLLYDPAGNNGLLNLWGKLFGLAHALDAARTGQVATKWQALQAVLDLAPEAEPAWRYRPSWLAAAGGWQGQITAAAQELLLRYVQEKNLPRPSLREALQLLIADLKAAGYYFAVSNRSIQVQASSGNQGDTALMVTDRNGLGWPCQLLPETITGFIEEGRLKDITGQLSPIRRGLHTGHIPAIDLLDYLFGPRKLLDRGLFCPLHRSCDIISSLCRSKNFQPPDDNCRACCYPRHRPTSSQTRNSMNHQSSEYPPSRVSVNPWDLLRLLTRPEKPRLLVLTALII